jgi:ribosomal protein S14
MLPVPSPCAVGGRHAVVLRSRAPKEDQLRAMADIRAGPAGRRVDEPHARQTWGLLSGMHLPPCHMAATRPATRQPYKCRRQACTNPGLSFGNSAANHKQSLGTACAWLRCRQGPPPRSGIRALNVGHACFRESATTPAAATTTRRAACPVPPRPPLNIRHTCSLPAATATAQPCPCSRQA